MLDDQYIEAIKKSEGYVPDAFWDYKQYTNGYGTKAAYPGEKIDEATADERFRTEIDRASKSVDAIVPSGTPEGTRAALISLTYNAGSGWQNSGLGDAVKAGDWERARELFLQYNKAGGAVNSGLVNRRQAEADWFGLTPAKVEAPPTALSPAGMAQAEQQPPTMPAFNFTPKMAMPTFAGQSAPSGMAGYINQPEEGTPQMSVPAPLRLGLLGSLQFKRKIGFG